MAPAFAATLKMRKYTEDRDTATCDTECLPNYWSIGFRCVKTHRVKVFELYEGQELDRERIRTIMQNFRLITFNGIKYDAPMIALALKPGTTNEQLKFLNDDLIIGGLPPWKAMQRYECRLPDFFDHVDLMEVSPASPQHVSLKMTAGRMHSKTIGDLPYDPDHHLELDPAGELGVLRSYHEVDLINTEDMYWELKTQIDLRCVMSDRYGVDLRSKSDAQIAEAVIKSELEKKLPYGKRLKAPDIDRKPFKITLPKFIQFQTPPLIELLRLASSADFKVRYDGVVEMPVELEGKTVSIGSTVYKIGMGGLHSQEKKVSHYSDDKVTLRDRDVTSYYPFTIINQGLFPKQLGPEFLRVYRGITDRRIEAKRAGRKDEAESLKIVVNGSFGKFGSPYSVIYEPSLMLQTTLTGQLSLLMLIEELEHSGFQVVSANTDGVVTLVPNDRTWEFNAICLDWEMITGYNTEEAVYKSLHSESVNSYIAFKPDGSAKRKGKFGVAGKGQTGAAGLKKAPNKEISVEAVIAYLRDGTSIEETIQACQDITKFVVVRRVQGGAEKDGELVGKCVRYYHSTNETQPLTYKTNGNNVATSTGARPVMTMPDRFPRDIDYDLYIREAYALLQDVGASRGDPAHAGLVGQHLGRLEDEKNFHILTMPGAVALCGKRAKSVRDKWVLAETVPEGHRMCGKCKKEEL